MQIKLKHFAIVRETLGRSTETREMAAGTTVAQVLEALIAEAPRLGSLRRAAMLMVNQEYVTADQVLNDGDELVVIPPVSGGAIESPGKLFRVTSDPLDPREAEAVVAAGDAGAVVTFTGTVRDHARGQSVTALDYEAYAPAAEKMLERIAGEIEERFGLSRIAIIHRTGLLQVGEASVVIAVSSAHREAAFDACKYAIERLKEIVPIWKKEFYLDGETWIGSEADYQIETGRIRPNS
jgi:molybdopterin synthase catalytic subunit